MVVYKRISTLEVMSIVDRQLQAGMADPAILLLKNLVQPLHSQEGPHESHGAALGGASSPVREDACKREEPLSEACEDELDTAAQKQHASVHCCICCFHWINRRRELPVTVLPMQSLLYFILGIDSAESKKCDKRVLNRLTMSIGEEEHNFWRSLFSSQELSAIQYIAQKRRFCLQIGQDFCIKREFAALYNAQNGNGMLLASSNIADLIRTAHSHAPLQSGGGFTAFVDGAEAFCDAELAYFLGQVQD
jgi:hypothetical protein